MRRRRGSRRGPVHRRVASSCGAGSRLEPMCLKEKGMSLKHQWCRVLLAAMLAGLSTVTMVAAAGEQFIPILSTRQGALRFVGIPQANAYIDYLTLLNERDGGINGVKLVWEDCDTF